MSDAPSEEQQTPTGTTNRRRLWTTVGLTLGAIATLGAAGGAWWAWVFVNEKLSPWVSELLTDTLSRPVTLGEVERVSLTGIRFGPSAVPPTETDPDTLYIDSITVRYNLLQLLTRQITPEIRLNEVQGYLEQAEDGRWIDTELDLPEDDDDQDPLIQVNPIIAIQDSDIVLQPFQADGETVLPLTIGNINGRAAIRKLDVTDPRNSEATLEAQEIDVELTAEPEEAGTLIVNGVIQQLDYGDDSALSAPDTFDAKLAIQAQQLEMAVLAPVILASVSDDLPLTVTAGTINGNLEVDVTPQSAPQVTGTASLDAGAIMVDPLPDAIDNINVQARFQGDRVALENVTAQYANISATAGGAIDARNGYDLSGETTPFELAELAEELELDLPVDVDGAFKAEATVTGPLADPQITGNLRSTDVTTVDQIQFSTIAAELLYTPAAVILSSLTIEPLDGGRLTGSGRYTLTDPAELSLQIDGRDLPADAIGRTYGLPETITLGAIDLDADISGPLADLSGVVSWQAPGGTFPTRGTAEVVASTVRIQEAIVSVAGGTVTGTGTLTPERWNADVVAQGIQPGVFNQALEGITVGGDLALAGTFDDLSLQGIRGDGTVTAALRGGTLNTQVRLADGNWNADVQTRDFPAGQFAPGLPIGGLTADVRLAGTVDDLTLNGVRGDGTVTAGVAGGTVTSDLQLANGAWQARGRGNALQLGQLSPDLQGTGAATFDLAGNLDDLSPTGITGQATVTLSDGLATAASLAPQLAAVRSPLQASLGWDGRRLQINSLETAGLSARGFIVPELSDPSAPGIAAIDLALAAEDYALSALPIDVPPLLALTGQATFNGRLTGTADNLNLNGDLTLANLALNDLVFDPEIAGDVQFSSQDGLAIALSGQEDEITVSYGLQPQQLNFRIQADETLAVGETQGDLLQAQVYNFPISALNLPPAGSTPYGTLRGDITFASAAVNLRDFTTFGQVNVTNLGLGYLSIDRLFGGFAYANGVASFNDGEIRIADKDTRGSIIPNTTRIYEIDASYAFNQPPRIQATLSTNEGQLQDILEILTIRELADLQRGLAPEEGFIPTSQAEAERLLSTVPAGNPNGSLLNQLRRLSEILELELQAEREVETAAFPPLSELTGAFRGQVSLDATLPDDITARFNIEGQSWSWGPDLNAEFVLARGSYQNGLVSLMPIRLSSQLDDQAATVAVSGDFSLDPEDQKNRELTLTVANLPIENLQGLANLPFEIGGQLNGQASLSGRLSDPELVGTVELMEGTLNRSPIDQANASFSYRGARLGLDTRLFLVDAQIPLTLSAQVPYPLPFVEREPSSDDFAIEANIQDEGFALLNLFTRQQVAWQAGSGEAILNLRGTWDGQNLPALSEESAGFINLEGATIALRALPEPLTDINGRIQLIRLDPAQPLSSSIVIEDLTGQFSDGELMAQGTLPLLFPLAESLAPEAATTPAPVADSPDNADSPENGDDPEDTVTATDTTAATTASSPRSLAQTPLTLGLSDIALNLKGLYNGQVNGDIIVGGSVLLGPELTGEIDLSNGIITIPEGNSSTNLADSTIPVRFSDLRLVLVDDISIVLGALVNVQGVGGLRLDGDLVDPRPSGRILLPEGKIELFATTLTLDGDNDRAEFRQDLGFDPILDVTLKTSLPDISSGSGLQPTTSPFPRNEIPDTTIDDLAVLPQQGGRLVQITARYTGLASEVGNLRTDLSNLELNSSPLRSTNEIISLLSGNLLGAFDTLQNSESALPGVATFAGAALLGRVRGFLGDTIPLSELRIFPVSSSSGDVNDSQDIGAEVGFDIRPKISVSILKVLTDDTSPQYNIRYRLNNQFNLRGTTSFEDFQERTGALLEYETRF